MTESLTYRGLRLDHPTADLFAFVKAHDRGGHSPFLEDITGWGLIVIDAAGIRRDVSFNIEPLEGRAHKALLPMTLAAFRSATDGEHVHVVSDQKYFTDMLNEGAAPRAHRGYKSRQRRPYADAEAWRELDAYTTGHNIGISAGRPVSEFAWFRVQA